MVSEIKAASSGGGVVTGCLIAIAAGGALIVIGFGALIYFGFVQRGGVYDHLRVQLAQTTLNQLVPYVELYRTQHGVYPDTIEQVQEVIPPNTPVMTFDPSVTPLGAPRAFYYEHVDAAHYILRGVGADGEPFTGDDIVPQGFAETGLGLLLERPTLTPTPPAASSDNPH